ncbi:MAG: rhodanese-like domain-containing protein, partial [Thermoproteus sp.]
MALVTSDWVLQNLNNPKVMVVEVDYDPNTAYNQWHVPGAVSIAW